MSPQSEGGPSVDRGEGLYGQRGGPRHQNYNTNTPSQYPPQVNGYGVPEMQRQRHPGPGPAQDSNANGYMQPPPTDPSSGRSRDMDLNLPIRERSRNNRPPGDAPATTPAAAPASKSTTRICNKCSESLTGPFVRALGGTFHLECFLCRDCDQIVASKFFPVDDESGDGQYPLCETDYFRRLDLLCSACGSALRGSYITALDRKYHIEHFSCSVCPTVFGAQDSYYEHVGKVYCHYHYSTQFAQRCNGCQTAILKQFVEIFRNGQNQHWHPECYMIHKFWNVRLAPPGTDSNAHLQLDTEANEEKRNQVRADEELMEEKVYRIWSTLSTFEESSAACISDMLLHVSNGAYMESVMVAKKFIWHVDILFGATDKLDLTIVHQGLKSLSYGREAKLLCKKIVAFFMLLTKTQETGVRKLGVTQELLSLVTGLAHYLKLLIRISLQGALRLERERRSIAGLNQFLVDLQDLESLKDSDKSLNMTAGVSELADQQSDICHKCKEPIDDECVRMDQQRWHKSHLTCDYCDTIVGEDLHTSLWSEKEGQVVCRHCHEQGRAPDAEESFQLITRLQQYVYLLRVALARLLKVLRSGGSFPHTSDDPNLTTYDSNDGHRVGQAGQLDPPLLRANSRSKSYNGPATSGEGQRGSSYEQTVGEMKRFRSTRMDTQLSTNIKKARTSRIMDGPEARQTRPGSAGADGSLSHDTPTLHIEEDTDRSNKPNSNLTFGNQDALTLDDIPRIVAAEQAKEQRPNAYRHAQSRLVGGNDKVKYFSGHHRDTSGGHEPDTSGDNMPQRTKRYFSELTALEYLIIRHVAVLKMEPLVKDFYNLEDLLNLIETRKPTFWGKFGKAFAGKDKPKGGKKKGVFGVPLDALVDRDGVESTYGVGPGALRIPAIIDDSVSAMRQMDMSVEGVFRKNGNIKGLRDLTEKFDLKEGEVDLTRESPVQVAALLKKFLRELPDPLLTYKLYNLFITSQKLNDEENRRRVLHLTCCLLPKSHRDSLEILFSFLNWAASFSQVDDESGSKMDAHNLATVIAPNILKERTEKTVQMDDTSFLGIEAVNLLLDYNDEMCEVPEDLQSILKDDQLFTNSSDITTKEILKRYGDIGRATHYPNIITENAHSPSQHKSSQATNGNSSTPATKAAASVITHVDTDSYETTATWPKESSVRHVHGQVQGSTTFPTTSNNSSISQQNHQFNFANHQSPSHRRGASSESQASARSGGRLTAHARGNSGWGHHGPPGGAMQPA